MSSLDNIDSVHDIVGFSQNAMFDGTTAEPSELRSLLRYLRRQAHENVIPLGSHQLNAHLSIAYSCKEPPEGWEIYRIAPLNSIPSTDFYDSHSEEIAQELQCVATWEFLDEYAGERLSIAKAVRKVQYVDGAVHAWKLAAAPAIDWFDAREVYKESLNETKAARIEKVNRNLENFRKKAKEDPSPKRLEQLANYEKFVNGSFLETLESFDANQRETRSRLELLERTRDFGKIIFGMVREAENAVRKRHGIAAVGEAWVSETELLYRVRKLLAEIEVIAHGQPRWLGRQHLDIWIPSRSIAIEYQGIQHFKAIERFGGADGFARTKARDQRKRKLCEDNGIRLIEIAYDQEFDDAGLLALLAT